MDHKKTIQLGGLKLGEGMPAVCIPVMGGCPEELGRSAGAAALAGADILELRIDSLCKMPDGPAALEAIAAVRRAAAGLPLIFTMRTERDGGAGSADAAAYERLLTCVAQDAAAEAIDCELSIGDDAFRRITGIAHANDVAVIGSSHAFGEIAQLETAASWLLRQQDLGADVCKAAVMTHSRAQAFELARIYASVYERLSIPMIAIAMGPAGVITRIAGECMGSCLTFGTAGRASAPGQIRADTLRQALEIVHSAMK